MLFSDFASYLQKLEGTSSRLEMMYQLADLFRQLDPSEVTPTCYLLQGQLLPPYDSLEFSVSVKTLLKVIARISNQSAEESAKTDLALDLFGEVETSSTLEKVTQEYKRIGDLGTVIEQALSASSTQTELSITQVYQKLMVIAQESGIGSQEKKQQGLLDLFSFLDPISAKFVVRMVLAKLRLGFATMTMLDALSWAMTQSKVEVSALEDAYQRRADIGYLATTYLSFPEASGRLAALAQITVAVGTPVVPALCQRLNSAQEIIEKMGEVIAEPKYDGLRIQIHIDKNAQPQLKTFTRNLEDTSHMFPELQTVIADLNCTTCILDAEGIGYERATGKFLPFQETITRKRKHDISTTAAEVPIRCFVFDVLAIDGESLINEKLHQRKDRLKKLFKDNEVLRHPEYIVTKDPDTLRAFHESQLAAGLEGAVIKQLASVYQSGRKGWSWVKIKETEGARGKLKDTLDCVVMGYYVGRGKRTTFGVGAFLVGILGEDQTLKTIAKIGTGLSDDQFRELKTRSEVLVTTTQPLNYEVPKGLVPDVWLMPQLVVEIAADEVTRSPMHTAGVALRFPRLVKFRDDKKWEDATAVTEMGGF